MTSSNQGLPSLAPWDVKRRDPGNEAEFLKEAFWGLSIFLPSLKDPSQPPPFSMPSKLLILHGEAKSYCFTVSCVPKNLFHYL